MAARNAEAIKQAEISAVRDRRWKVSRLLRKQVVREKNVDLTNIVASRIELERKKTK